MSRITLNRKDFIKALQLGGAFAGRSKTLPILDCVKISVKGGKGKIVSSDSENTISKAFDVVESDADVTFCIRCKDLMSYVKLISGDIFAIELDESLKSANILHSKGKAEYPLEDYSAYPVIKPSSEVKEIELSAALLNNWIVDGQGFVANDELRPQMNGIYFYQQGDEVGFCATDGHFLVTDHIEGSGEDWNFILTNTVFSTLCSAISNVETVKLRLSSDNILFIADGISIMSRLVDGRYPNFKSVLPSSFGFSVKLDKKEALESLNRCLLTTNPSSSLIKLTFDSGSLSFEAQDIDFARKNTEKIACECSNPLRIGFNGKKMISCINAIESDSVEMCLTSPERPCVFKDTEKKNFSALLMPMLLND